MPNGFRVRTEPGAKAAPREPPRARDTGIVGARGRVMVRGAWAVYSVWQHPPGVSQQLWRGSTGDVCSTFSYAA